MPVSDTDGTVSLMIVMVLVFDELPENLSVAYAVIVYVPVVGVHVVVAEVVPEAIVVAPFLMVTDWITSPGSESVAEAEIEKVVPAT